MEEKILEFLGKIVAYGGGAAVIAYLIFAFLGKKTLETWFAKRLRKFEYELNSLFNRATKIHEKEFEVLPEAWTKLDNLLDLARQFIRETHSIPDLNNKSSQELEVFLSKQNLNEDEKQNVRKHNDKRRWYFHVKSDRVGNACLDFQDYITKNAIFLSSDLKSEFKKAEETIRTAWATRSTAEESKDRNKHIMEACQIIQKQMKPIVEKIEELVQKRLRFFEA
jgi:hypothetical protein